MYFQSLLVILMLSFTYLQTQKRSQREIVRIVNPLGGEGPGAFPPPEDHFWEFNM